MKFKEWLQKEVATSTANVASFARPIFSVMKREISLNFLNGSWGESGKSKKKKGKKKRKSD